MARDWLRRLRGLPVPRIARFALVGASGVGVNSGVLWLLYAKGELPLVLASAFAIETAIWNNFLLNDLWTFHEERGRRRWWERVLAFHATAGLAAGVTLAVLLFLEGVVGLHYLVANLVAIGFAAAVNYGVNAVWTWRPAAPRLRPLPPLSDASKVIVVVPTYNEAQNVRQVVDKVLSQGLAYEVLIVDDASPDGTADVVAKRAQASDRLHLVRRPGKMGIGSAYVDGFRTALCLGADLVIQMDCDLSHDPSDLPRLVAAAREAHVVVGSRYVPGGGATGWSWYRQLISRGTGLAYRALLGMAVRDLTGGFKCWRREALETLPLEDVGSKGFAFQIEMNYLTWRDGFTIREVPVTFVERQLGRSKMSLAISVEAARLLWRLALGTPALRRP